ncbi:MAG TPA: hypothetical protein VHX86_05810 [Tepidisphaeraceae bacterium]|jgi:hypothetical protein|nr:hypothetical protein [Tepidisphaeraceae bacterium]
MTWLKKILDRGPGKAVVIVLAILAIGAALYIIRNSITSPAVAAERERIFIDATTGKAFNHELRLGETIPVEAPSGNKSGYPAELCYWTKDGHPKKDPTAVLLNSWIGKPGPTFCPDCGRLVVEHNPMAMPGMTPPPTREEYERRIMGVGPELLHAVADTH